MTYSYYYGKFVVSTQPSEGWMARIVADAERMHPGAPDREYFIGSWTHIKLMVQEELPPRERSWWVRWVNAETQVPIAGYECHDLLTVLAAVSSILDQAGVPVE